MNNTATHSQVNFLPVMRILQDLATSAELNAVVMGNVALKKQITAEEFGNNIMQIAHVNEAANTNDVADKNREKLRVSFKDTRNMMCHGIDTEKVTPVVNAEYKNPVAIQFAKQADKIGADQPTTLFVANSNHMGQRTAPRKKLTINRQRPNAQIISSTTAQSVKVIYLKDRRQKLAKPA